MILAVDVYYFDDKARAVGLLFERWQDESAQETLTADIESVEEYTPGEFYKRELPCIMAILNKLEVASLEGIVVDGYVYLDDQERPGLGKRLFDKLNENIPIIGVAKTAFHGNKVNVLEVSRGGSKKPHYVSAVGMDLEVAADLIQNMHGQHRMPNILKHLDTLTKAVTVSFNTDSHGLYKK